MNKAIPYPFNPNITYPAYLTRNRLLKTIALVSPKLNGRLLDFGCGAKPYKSLFNVDEYVGLDFENPGHPHLNEQIDVFYDGKKLPFEDNSFDAVFSSEVFEHVFNLEDILTELNRVLKQDGMMLITCPFSICEHEVPNDFARYSSYSIKYLLEKNGFEVIEQYKTGNSLETISQLKLTYINQHIMPYVRKIPFLRSAFRLIVFTSINLSAIVFGKIFPSGMDLYLNNIVLSKKSND